MSWTSMVRMDRIMVSAFFDITMGQERVDEG